MPAHREGHERIGAVAVLVMPGPVAPDVQRLVPFLAVVGQVLNTGVAGLLIEEAGREDAAGRLDSVGLERYPRHYVKLEAKCPGLLMAGYAGSKLSVLDVMRPEMSPKDDITLGFPPFLEPIDIMRQSLTFVEEGLNKTVSTSFV